MFLNWGIMVKHMSQRHSMAEKYYGRTGTYECRSCNKKTLSPNNLTNILPGRLANGRTYFEMKLKRTKFCCPLGTMQTKDKDRCMNSQKREKPNQRNPPSMPGLDVNNNLNVQWLVAAEQNRPVLSCAWFFLESFLSPSWEDSYENASPWHRIFLFL